MNMNLHKNRHVMVFSILLLISSVWMLINGARSEKTFCDEYWTYGLANSDEPLYLYPKYKDSWVSSEILKKYLTVQKDERFVFNEYIAGQDTHPLLYHFILHTVCSLFPDTYSKWYGLGINFVFFIGTCIVLYLLSAALFNSHKKAAFASSVWMFSMGALNTFVYIRMYVALTFFVVCALYYAVKYFIEQKNKYLIGLYVSFVLGGLTEYTFWIVGFLITGFFFVFTIRNWRKWLAFSGVALASVATASLVFPPTILQFLDKSNENEVIKNSFSTASTLFNPREVFNRFMVECKERFFPFILSNKVIFFVLLVSLLILIYNVYNVLRNLFMEWWNNERTKNIHIFGFMKGRFVLWIKDIGNNPHKSVFVMLFFVYGIAVYFIEAVHLWPYIVMSTRFVFMLYPLQSILIALVVIGIYKQIKNLARIPQCIVIVLIVLNFVMVNNGKKPLAPAPNWFVYEDSRVKYEQFNSIVSDAHVFFVRKNWYDHHLFNTMARYYDRVKEIYPMQREENPLGYDYQHVIAGQIEQIQSGEKIVIMNMNEDGAFLNKDRAFVSLLNSRGFDIVTVETGVDIGFYSLFNVYGIVPYPDTPALKQKRIQQETDITRYLSWIHDERYSILIAVSDECSVSMNEEIMSKLRELGLTQNLIGKLQLPYIAVIDRGEVVYEALGGDTREPLTWTGALQDGSEYEILSAGYHAGNTCAITLDGADYAVKWRGLNIVVYDNETKQVLDSVAFDTLAQELTAYRKRTGEWTELLIENTAIPILNPDS